MTTTMCDKVLEEFKTCGTLKHGCIGYLLLIWQSSEANAWLAYRAFADSQEYKTHCEFRKVFALELLQQLGYEDTTAKSKLRSPN